MVINIIMWSMFGLFFSTIIASVLWGFKRGLRKSLFRFALLSIACLLAFFLAPTVAGLFANIRIPGLTEGMGLRTWIEYQAIDNIDGAYNFPELLAFATALPVAIASLVVFVGLIFLFRFITWIFYMIFAKKVAPNQAKHNTGDKTANGMDKFEIQDVKRRRFLGACIGLVAGFTLFVFIYMPINGAMDTLNRATTFNPSINTNAPVQMFNSDINPLASLTEDLHDINRDIQRSPYGFVSRYTGIQWISGPMFGHMTRVSARRLPTINLRNDVIAFSQTLTDFVVLHQNFFYDNGESRDVSDVMATLDPIYFDLAEQTIDNLFKINLTRLLTTSMQNFVNFLGENFINDLTLFDDDQDKNAHFSPYPYSTPDQSPEYHPTLNNRFNNSLLATLRLMDHNFLRNDLIQTIRITQQLFQPVPPTTPEPSPLPNKRYPSLFDGFQGIVNNISSLDNLNELNNASDDFAKIIGTNAEISPLKYLFDEIFVLGLFRFILSNDNPQTHDLIKVPLIYYLSLSEDALNGLSFNWENMSVELTNTIMVANSAIVAISELTNNLSNILENLENLSDLEAIADLLDLVGTLGINDQVNDIVHDLLADNIDMEDLATSNPDAYTEINNVLSYLQGTHPDPSDFNWLEQLTRIQNTLNQGGQ